jgi:hypothetical protein
MKAIASIWCLELIGKSAAADDWRSLGVPQQLCPNSPISVVLRQYTTRVAA